MCSKERCHLRRRLIIGPCIRAEVDDAKPSQVLHVLAIMYTYIYIYIYIYIYYVDTDIVFIYVSAVCLAVSAAHLAHLWSS